MIPKSGNRFSEKIMLKERNMRTPKIIDISLELDVRNFHMRTPVGFKRDMQFEVEVIKDFDAAGGAGQIVRGVHMRLHAGSHVDAPEHFVKGGKQIHELPLDTFLGPAVVADVRHRMPGGGITGADLDKAAGSDLQEGDRLLLRTDCNVDYDGSMEWQKRSPYLTNDAIDWCLGRRVPIVGFDMYHGADAPDSSVVFNTSRRFQEAGVVTMPYLKNLGAISRKRVTLIALPLKMIGVEASPIRAVVLEE
jgi:arylformamidase